LKIETSHHNAEGPVFVKLYFKQYGAFIEVHFLIAEKKESAAGDDTDLGQSDPQM
jgi:hypothetical protein